jgi:acyl carrier protein
MSATITREAVEEKVIDAIAEIGPEREEITRGATLAALDIDSLDLIEIAQIIAEELGVWLTAEDAEALRSVEDVFDLVWQRAQS